MFGTMRRGKSQILLNYLPGKPFDYAGISTIAEITRVHGVPNQKINIDVVLNAVQEYASAWGERHRPFSGREFEAENFVLLDPTRVEAAMFPLVFHCQNASCGYVMTGVADHMPRNRACPRCRTGKMEQLSFIKVHRCGDMQPLTPPYSCSKCASTGNMALNTRGSERISGFRWRCMKCGENYPLFGGKCRACDWTDPVPGVTSPQNMDIEKFRAGRTYYAHRVVLLNQPGQHMDAFLNIPEWPLIAGATFLQMPEVQGRKLVDFGANAMRAPVVETAITNADLDNILARFHRSEITAEQMASELAQNRDQRMRNQREASPSNIGRTLIEHTGVDEVIWRRAGRELVEAVLPLQSDTVQHLFSDAPVPMVTNLEAARYAARTCGIAELTSVNDFPMTNATFGYSRAEYQPDRCDLKLFPPDGDHEGKFPIFVSLVQADAIVIRLDAERVWHWLSRNDVAPTPQPTSNLARRAYFIELFSQPDVQPAVTLRRDQLQVRMVFGLLHTLSHLCIRQAALLCGLEGTSLSEYILPGALTFALYCSHSSGATIGALTSLFEQSLLEWLGQVRDHRRCVYDPVCERKGGNCHACTHLAETSCRFFNLNLSRAFLFGGVDDAGGDLYAIPVGYFDPILGE